MLRFLIKGVLRDRSRSLFSFIAIVMGVLLAVLFRGFMAGVFDDMLHQSAVLMTGHVKVTTRAWVDEADIMPNDLAVLDVDSLVAQLSTDYPEMDWDPRILFAGLLDVPDDVGETRAQGPMLGIAVDFLSPESGARQVELWELDSRLVRGRLPASPEEVLLGERFATRLGIEPGEVGTFVGATMHGGFATYNFHVVGTVALGVGGIDQNLLLADLTGARAALDMEDGASAIFGLYKDMFYDDAGSVALSNTFNQLHSEPEDEFSLMMQPLRAQNSLGQIVDFSKGATLVIILIFMFIVVVLLWNLGLMNGLRRYGEFGVRLAMGETNEHEIRSVLTVVKINNELERIADCAVNIAEEVANYGEMLETIPSTFRVMANSVVGMLRDATRSLSNLDKRLAEQVLGFDDTVDQFKREIILDAQQKVASGEFTAKFAFKLLTVAKSLERVADHSTNICEQVIYLESGMVVRHMPQGWSKPARPGS